MLENLGIWHDEDSEWTLGQELLFAIPQFCYLPGNCRDRRALDSRISICRWMNLFSGDNINILLASQFVEPLNCKRRIHLDSLS